MKRQFCSTPSDSELLILPQADSGAEKPSRFVAYGKLSSRF